METVLEIIVEFLLDGLIEFGTAQETPKTLRGIFLAVVTSVMLGFGGFCVYCAVTEASNIAGKVLFILIALLMLAGCIGFWRKIFKKRKSQKDE